MKITVKTLQQKVFQVCYTNGDERRSHTHRYGQLDAEDSDTVADLKKKIHETQGHPAESQRLIFSGEDLFIAQCGCAATHGGAFTTTGKVLADDKTVESCAIKEKDFLVLTVTKVCIICPSTLGLGLMLSCTMKPKQATRSAAPAASTSTAAAPATPNAPSPVAAPSTPAVPQPPNAPVLTPAQPAVVEPTPPAETRSVQDGNAFVTGSALQTSIQNMIEMGFERDQVMKALRASFNNPERAVEYLFNVRRAFTLSLKFSLICHIAGDSRWT
jgi:UV excision repair protein RAD23